MNLPTTTLLVLFVAAAWAVDPPTNQSFIFEDSLDFVDDDGAQPEASLAGIGVTQATIITATPANETVSNIFSLGSSTTDDSTIVTSSTVTPTTVTSPTVSSTTVSSTQVTPTTVSSTTASLTTSTTTAPTTTTAQPSEEDIFLALLAKNTVALTESEFLANTLNTKTSNIISELDDQVKSLALIDGIEKLLLNVTGSLAVSEADLLQSLVNSIYKVDYFGNRTINTVAYLLKYQELNRDRVNNFSNKLSGMQGQILRSTKGLDDKLKLVNQILKQYIAPRVNNLKNSLANINVSQVNSEAELKDLPEVQNLTKTSIIKLTSLTNQVAILNHTGDKNLYLLEEAVNGLDLANLKTINELLHSVSISQKRIDLAISVCENRRSEYVPNKYANPSENYRNDYISQGSEGLFKSPINNSKNCSSKVYIYEKLPWNMKATV